MKIPPLWAAVLAATVPVVSSHAQCKEWDAEDGSGPALYVGGTFTDALGVSAGPVAKWNGTRWSPVGPPGSGPASGWGVAAMAVFDDGSGPALYVGGIFQQPPSNIARWDGTSWSS